MVNALFFHVMMDAGTQWLHSRVDINGYEEFSGIEYRSAGCSEEYYVIEWVAELLVSAKIFIGEA
jgi:hypothetical protein